MTVLGAAAGASLIGADARWLAALGSEIVGRGAIPHGIPFASAPTTHWQNSLVLAELLFHWLEAGLGDRGLMLAQLLAVTVAVLALTRDARAQGASDEAAGTAVLLTALGALASFAIVRVQLFSLALFPLLAALLRAEYRRPSPRIWLVLPLIAVWANLHGAVLIGVALVWAYLALSRVRVSPVIAAGVGVGTMAASCATPAGVQTISYYQGLISNVAASRGAGLWSPLSLTAPLDVLLVVIALLLLPALRRSRPAPWELAVMLGLAAETIQASRTGVWLLLFAAVPAARGLRRIGWLRRLMAPLATVALVGLVATIARGPQLGGVSGGIVSRAIALAHGTPILADAALGEQIALAGGRIWVGNPIDAFSKRDQSTYLDWLAGDTGGLRAVGSDIDVVLTAPGTGGQRLMARDRQFSLRVAEGMTADLYVRRRTRVG